MMKGGGHGVVSRCPCQRWRKAARMRMQAQCFEGLASACRLGDSMAAVLNGCSQSWHEWPMREEVDSRSALPRWLAQ